MELNIGGSGEYSHPTREIEIPLRGKTLRGHLELPVNSRGLVLFAHGSGSSRKSPRNLFVARILGGAGLGTLLFDLLTSEEEKNDFLTARHRFDIELLAERLEAALDWTFRNLGSDLEVGLFGASTGAGAALVVAAEQPERVKSVVSRGGRPDLAGSFLSRVKAPTLFIVGENDDVVIDLNQAAFEKLTCEKELAIIPKATHLFEEPGALEAVATLAENWFSRHLSPIRQAPHEASLTV